MPLFSPSKNKKIAVFDFSSGSVGGSWVELDKQGEVRILFSARKPVNFLFDVSFEAFWRCAADSFDKILKRLAEFSSGSRPDKVFCVFSSPWYVSQTNMVSMEMEKPAEVDEKFLRRIIHEEEQKIVEAARKLKNLKKSPAKNEKFLIEHKIIKAELNGYPVRNPLGKKAKKIKMLIYVSIAPKAIVEKIKTEMSKNFGHAPVIFATFPNVVLEVLSGVVKTKENYAVVEAREEITDIAVTNDSFLDALASFPRGTNLLFRSVAGETGGFLPEAPSVLRAYSRGHRILEGSEKITSALKKGEKEWSSFFRKAAAEMSEKTVLPQNVFLLGDESAEKYLADGIGGDEFSEFTVLGKPLRVEKVGPGWFRHYFADDYRSEAEHTHSPSAYQDVFLMIESLYAGRRL